MKIKTEKNSIIFLKILTNFSKLFMVTSGISRVNYQKINSKKIEFEGNDVIIVKYLERMTS